MAGYFEATGDGAAVALDHVEISILRSLAAQLLELIGPGEEAGDPLDALFAEGPSEPPRDPALARLFPDAYGEPDREHDEETRGLAAEFRRYTEGELRDRKREDLLAMVRGLDELTAAGPAAGGTGPAEEAAEEEAGPGAAVLTLDPGESRRWLGALNDLRLAIAARLGITDEEAATKLATLPDSHPDKPMILAYLWLGGLQESLVETLRP